MPASPRCLFVIAATFAVKGRGIALAPGISPEGDERFRVGDTVELRKPDATVVRTKIKGIEILSPIPPSRAFVILLAETFKKEDVPIGTEVWSIGDSSGPTSPDSH